MLAAPGEDTKCELPSSTPHLLPWDQACGRKLKPVTLMLQKIEEEAIKRGSNK